MSLKENVLRATCLKHQIAVSRGPLLTTSRSTSLRRCSQTVTPLRLRAMQIRHSGTTSLLLLPLLTSSPMALVLPTSTGNSREPKKLQLFLPMLPPKPPVRSKFLFCEILIWIFKLLVWLNICVWQLLFCLVLIS